MAWAGHDNGACSVAHGPRNAYDSTVATSWLLWDAVDGAVHALVHVVLEEHASAHAVAVCRHKGNARIMSE